jgi:hypothetical protein
MNAKSKKKQTGVFMKTKQNFQTALDGLRALALKNAPEEGQNFTVIPSIV